MNRMLLDRIATIARRRERFTYDLRSKCLVYSGIVCAFAPPRGIDPCDLVTVSAHALLEEGILGAWRKDGPTTYESCRLFTDVGSALRFAREQQRTSVYDLHRQVEVPVPGPPGHAEPLEASEGTALTW